jgi:hypothetical protein
VRAVAFDGFELVVEHQTALVEQTADERALAVVDRAAGDEAQQRLALVAGQELLDLFGGGVESVTGDVPRSVGRVI